MNHAEYYVSTKTINQAIFQQHIVKCGALVMLNLKSVLFQKKINTIGLGQTESSPSIQQCQ